MLDIAVVIPPDVASGLSVVGAGAVEVIITVVALLVEGEGRVASAEVVNVVGIVDDEKIDDVLALLVAEVEALVTVVRGGVDVGGVRLDVGMDELRGAVDGP